MCVGGDHRGVRLRNGGCHHPGGRSEVAHERLVAGGRRWHRPGHLASSARTLGHSDRCDPRSSQLAARHLLKREVRGSTRGGSRFHAGRFAVPRGEVRGSTRGGSRGVADLGRENPPLQRDRVRDHQHHHHHYLARRFTSTRSPSPSEGLF